MHRTDDLRRMLAENAAHKARADAYGHKIRESAATELAAVEKRLSDLTPGDVLTQEVKANEYRRLIEDRARLERLTGVSK